MKIPLRVLLIEDEENDEILLIRKLKQGGFNPVCLRVEESGEMEQALRNETWDIIISDYKLPKFNGIAALHLYKKFHIDTPFIIVSGTIGEEVAVEAMRNGAHDYVMKNNLDRLIPAISRELKDARTRQEQKLAEEKFQISEQLYSSLVKTATDAIVSVNSSGEITSWNNSAEKIFGYNAESVIGENIILIVPDKYKKMHTDGFKNYLKTGIAKLVGRKIETVGLRKDGYEVPIELSMATGTIHKTTFFTAIIRDITERKVAEAALRELSARNEAILASVPDIIMEIDNNHCYSWANRAGMDFFGEDVIGKKISCYFEGVQRSDMDAELLYEGSDEIVLVESWQKRKDGEKRLLAWRGRPLKDEKGKPIGILSSANDITEKKNMEEKLRNEKEKLKKKLETEKLFAEISQVLNLSVDFETNLNVVLGMIALNFQLDKISLYQLNQSTSKAEVVSEGMVKADKNPYHGTQNLDLNKIKILSNYIVEGRQAIIEDIESLPAAEYHYLQQLEIGSFILMPIYEGGRIIGLLICSMKNSHMWEPDFISVFETLANIISNAWQRHLHLVARLNAEREKGMAVQLMEKSSRLASIGVMAGGITHEINQPLNAIKVTADSVTFWDKRNPGVIPSMFIEKMGKISGGVNRISEIIKHMRAFWETPDVISVKETDVNYNVKRAVSLISRQLMSHNVKLELNLHSNPLLIRVNPTHIEQLVINLTTNSMQALDETELQDKKIIIETGTEEEAAVLKISDNGPGLSDLESVDIFDPFYSSKKPGKGMGLGLAIIKKIVDNYKGNITVANLKTGGAEFTINFPLTEDK